jgi:hypothetical protein
VVLAVVVAVHLVIILQVETAVMLLLDKEMLAAAVVRQVDKQVLLLLKPTTAEVAEALEQQV